jgi:hypothetical protein
MRKVTVSVLSMLCLFAGLAIGAGTAVAQNPTPRPNVSLTPESLFFSVSAGHSATAPTVLSNDSGAALNITKIEIDGVCSTPSNCGTQFHVVSHGCGATLKNGGNCTINVEFVPAADVETAHATLKVTFNGASIAQTRKVALTGVSRP